MVSALLINPGFHFKKPNPKSNYIFPFGLGYIATYAEKYGHKIDVWDIYGKLKSYDDAIEEMRSFDLKKYDFIGITGIVNQYLYIKKLTENLKKYTDAKIVVGGPLSSYSWELILKDSKVDICVIGEGEQTFLELLNGNELKSVDGIAYRTTTNGIEKTPDRAQIKNLDEIGIPAFHLFDMDFYTTHTGFMDVVKPFYKHKRGMALITTRGCPYNCKFCSKSVGGIRMKSLDFLFKEIEYYKNELEVDSIHFVDELLLLNKKRFLEFCDRIQKYKILWDCQGRINLVNEQILLAMKKAGAICIGFGIESGSQKILDNMDKRIKTSDIEKYLAYCLKIRLPVKVQVIYGYPGESRETLNETINLFKKTRLPGRRFTVITPLPGSEVYEMSKLDGFIGDKESDQISEINYLKFLSFSRGNVTPELFYNRTEIPDKDFIITLRKIENIIFNNFIKELLLHPSFALKYWSVYKMYLRNWWENRGSIVLFNVPKIIPRVIINPRKNLRMIKIFLQKN